MSPLASRRSNRKGAAQYHRWSGVPTRGDPRGNSAKKLPHASTDGVQQRNAIQRDGRSEDPGYLERITDPGQHE